MEELDELLGEDFSATKLKKEFGEKKRELMRNLPHIIVAVVLVIALLASFAEFKFTNIKTEGFAANSILFALLTYLTYYLKKYIGKRRGKSAKIYLDAKKAHEETCRKVKESLDKEHSLAEFCTQWVSEEADRARKTILSGTGVSDEEWAHFAPLGDLCENVILTTKKLKKQRKKEKISQAEYDLLTELKALPGEKKLAICCACLVKKQRLTPADLIYETATKAARERTPIRINRIERRHDLMQLLSVTVTLTGVLAVIPEIASVTITPMAILMALLKIVSLLWTGFNADVSGETLYTVDAVENFAVQDALLEEAIKWRRSIV